MYAFDLNLMHDDRTASFLFVQAQRGETLEMVLERVRSRGVGNDGIFVRTPVDIPIAEDQLTGAKPDDTSAIVFLGDPSNRFRRAHDRSVHVISSNGGTPYLTPNINAEFPIDRVAELGMERDDMLASVRQQEMVYLVERSKALLTAPPDALFRAPSGHLVANFVRVGNIQCDRDAVDSVFFWMLPYLRDVDAILVDTWSISSIAFNAARAATTYFGRADIRVEMLGDYVQGAGSSTEAVREAVKRLQLAIGQDSPRKMLVLISATQSGDLVTRLREIVPAVDPTLETQHLAIFRLGQTDFPTLADFADDKRFHILAPDANKSVSEIDSQVYFPLTFKDLPVRLSMTDATRHRKFFNAYRNTGLVQVHCDDVRSDGMGGHQAVHLDLQAIIGHPRFNERLNELLAPMADVRAILAPDHAQAQALAFLAAANLTRRGAAVQIMPTIRRGALANDQRQRELRARLADCGPDDAILVIDDLCVTTGSLAQIDKQLRTEQFEGRVHYLIGIARLADTIEWDGFTSRLAQRGGLPPHTVNSVESVTLPNWDADRCPWCCELNLYDNWIRRGLVLPGQLDRRRDMLANRGLSDLEQRAFFHPECLDVPVLGDKSFFVVAPCSQAEVFASTAAALQSLRSRSTDEQPRLGERHFPIATPLDDQDYLEQKWTDTVIRAAILRGATREELVWTDPAHEAERTKRLDRLLANPDAHEHDVLLEILLAACLGKATLATAGPIPAGTIARDDGTIAFLLGRLKESRRS